MFTYEPLWQTMKEKGFTTYTLRVKHGMSNGTVQRLRKNMSVSTNTLDDLCHLLDCEISDIIKFVKNDDPA